MVVRLPQSQGELYITVLVVTTYSITLAYRGNDCRLQGFLKERGFRVFIAPEAATIFFLNGAAVDDLSKARWYHYSYGNTLTTNSLFTTLTVAGGPSRSSSLRLRFSSKTAWRDTLEPLARTA